MEMSERLDSPTFIGSIDALFESLDLLNAIDRASRADGRMVNQIRQ